MAAMMSLSDPLPDHYDDLRQVTLALAAEVKAKTFELAALKFERVRLKRWRCGARDPSALDIDQLTEAELLALNRRSVERLRFLHHMRAPATMLRCSLGDRVTFDTDDGSTVVDTLMRYNEKSVKVVTDDHHPWNVSPVFLRRAEPHNITPNGPEPLDLVPVDK